jgi:hypothetical protein
MQIKYEKTSLVSEEYHDKMAHIFRYNLCEHEAYHNFTSQLLCEEFENGIAKEVYFGV